MRARWWTTALSSALSAASCTGEGAEQPDAKSKYIDLYLDEGIDVCGGQLAAYDDFVERAFDLWGEQVSEGFRAAVRVTHEPGCRGVSCLRNGEVRLGSQLGEYHELAHVVHNVADGLSVTSANEGAAEAIGPYEPYVMQSAWLTTASIDFLFALDTDDTSYPHAAILTRYLIDEYGIEAFRSYFRAMMLPEHPSPDDFRREFGLAFGEPLDDVWSDVISQDRCPYDFWYCEPWDPIELPHSIDGIDCSAPSTLGFEALEYARPNVPYKPMAIVHVEIDGEQPLVLESPDVGHLTFKYARCGACSPVPLPIGIYDDLSDCTDENPCNPIAMEFQLDAGRYAFIFEQFPDEPPVRVNLTEKAAP